MGNCIAPTVIEHSTRSDTSGLTSVLPTLSTLTSASVKSDWTRVRNWDAQKDEMYTPLKPIQQHSFAGSFFRYLTGSNERVRIKRNGHIFTL